MNEDIEAVCLKGITLIACVGLLLLWADSLVTNHQIAKSPDPIAAACALGRQDKLTQACEILKQREAKK